MKAQVYMREGDDEMTYFLLFRHAHLFLSHLSTHPEYRKNDTEAKAMELEVAQNLKALDVLRPRINRRSEEHQKAVQERLKQREQQITRVPQRAQDKGYENQGQDVRSSAQLRGYENSDIAARLADQEFSRRGSSRRAHPTGSSLQFEGDDLAAHMRAIRNTIEQNQQVLPTEIDRQRQEYLEKNNGYKYPVVPTQHADSAQSQSSRPLPYHATNTDTAPVLPPKPIATREPRQPQRPAKVIDSALHVKAATEPSYTFAPGACLENGTPLRTIFLPPTLRTTFLRLAYKNTLKNVETCGFLAGTLKANALFVSALVVPKQTATSDTCEMTDESELFDYVDQHDLMILGWIHTHPTQTCFMSSRDLHTHSGYQMMLAESIAVVCAPSMGDTSHGGDFGVYRLTDPPGKMAILQCDKPGIFHPHDVDNIYTDAMKPGHVMELSTMEFEVVDLR